MRRDTALAVIPARGQSTRVPRKNIRPLCGRPLLAYTVEAALESGLFAQVIVSTDSAEIARIARRSGADVPFIRGASLSDHETPVSAVTVDALERLDPSGRLFTWVAQLMPTCPLRTASDVRASFAQFMVTRAVSQLSVARYGWQPAWWAMRRTDDYTLAPVFPDEIVARSQDLPPVFCPTGAIWWARAVVLRQTRTYHVEGRTGWEIEPPRGVDIDTEDDFRLAEALMQTRRAMAHAR